MQIFASILSRSDIAIATDDRVRLGWETIQNQQPSHVLIQYLLILIQYYKLNKNLGIFNQYSFVCFCKIIVESQILLSPGNTGRISQVYYNKDLL